MRRRLCLACLLLLLSPVSWAADKTPEEIAKDLERLRGWLRGPSSTHWVKAAKEAQQLAPHSEVLLPELCMVCINTSKPVRQSALDAIDAIHKPLYEPIVQLITSHHLTSTQPFEREANDAIAKLIRLGPNAKPTAPMLLKLGEIEAACTIAPEDDFVIDYAIKLGSARATREWGLRALSMVKLDERRESKALDCMIAGVKEGHVRVISKRLGEMGSHAKRALPALKDAKGARLKEDRDAATDAIDTITQAIADEAENK